MILRSACLYTFLLIPEQTIVINGLSKSHAMTGWRFALSQPVQRPNPHHIHQYLVTAAEPWISMLRLRPWLLAGMMREPMKKNMKRFGLYYRTDVRAWDYSSKMEPSAKIPAVVLVLWSVWRLCACRMQPAWRLSRKQQTLEGVYEEHWAPGNCPIIESFVEDDKLGHHREVREAGARKRTKTRCA